MGLRDIRAAAATAVAEKTNATGRYFTEVNRGSVNMSSLTKRLNEMADQGWRLHTAFEQAGNTVLIYERA